jgi:hypothetical protein
MANTKKLERTARKAAKRASRVELKKLNESLTRKRRAEFRKAGKGIKAFLAEAQKKTAEA